MPKVVYNGFGRAAGSDYDSELLTVIKLVSYPRSCKFIVLPVKRKDARGFGTVSRLSSIPHFFLKKTQSPFFGRHGLH